MMRVSDFAKQAGLPAGIVLFPAKDLGLEGYSTPAKLDADEESSLRGWADGPSGQDKQTRLAD